MELSVTGLGRNHGKKVIARREITEAQVLKDGHIIDPKNYSRSQIYLTTVEGTEIGPSGIRGIDHGQAELRFCTKVTMNGEYLAQITMSRKEILKLFLSQYENCSLAELLEVIKDVKSYSHVRSLPPVLYKLTSEIDLPQRITTWLAKNNIWHVGELAQKTEKQLQSLPELPESSSPLWEIQTKLAQLGLDLGMKIPRWSVMPSPLDKRLDDEDEAIVMSIRVHYGLKKSNILYIGDLVQKSEADLLRIPEFGQRSINEIKEMLAGRGLELGMEWPNWRSPDKRKR